MENNQRKARMAFKGRLNMNSNNNKIISILEEFLDFLKEKEEDSKEKEVKVMTTESEDDVEDTTDDVDDVDFDKEIVKISKGE